MPPFTSGAPDFSVGPLKASESYRVPLLVYYDLQGGLISRIRVARSAFPFPKEPLRVLYVLDANLLFGTAVEMTRLISQLYGELPPLLVVGIAYNTSDPLLHSELRTRDFTPTTYAFGPDIGSMPGLPAPTLPPDRRTGRSAEFLQFLIDEVQSLIEEKYDVAENGKKLFGSSLGGLFTLYTLLNRPDAFDAYVAVSPALWWDNLLLLSYPDSQFVQSDDLDVKIYLAVGAEEEREDIPGLSQFRMVSNVGDFAEKLRNQNAQTLKLNTFLAEGESHTTIIPVALTRALRFIYSFSVAR